ncbi:hypothetical protein RDWZM_009283 [Blomia tropicalis]|uniref:U4/U6.U5 tri-snRNP-associated protein 1 n=1 Tax=Blomia tropicalis TaxID=40697 RepID=A0A9Q0RM63_BLOTA|nr:U4/U6.U5 tri-snRNP-associated protein 1 [Blomia tropicalis]KAJ6218126.1 hypothetical protein RDWZM_009283 [Blomia tropicalis]
MAEANEIFIKTENIHDQREAEKIRDRLQTQREKRLLTDKLKNVPKLVDSDEEEDAADWYERMRHKDKVSQQTKYKRQRREESKESEQSIRENSKRLESKYTGKDLKGLAIGHKVDSFKDGQNVILTLRDNDVLNDGEDVLENVNILDNEKAAKNVENKTKKPDYKPYDDDEFDEFGILKKTSLLSKYDEEIEGVSNPMFRIGEPSGEQLAKMKLEQQQQDGKISLSLPDFKIASEYYTEEEMTKFKKPKKLRKGTIRKRGINIPEPKVEVIKPVENSETNHKDHGSRSSKSSKSDRNLASKSSQIKTETKPKVKLDLDRINDELELDIIGPDEDLTGICIEEDEAEKELFSALNKTRKLKLKEKKDNLDPALDVVKLVGQEGSIVKMEDDNNENEIELFDNKGNIVLNTTAEFCRNLGDLPMMGGSTTYTSMTKMDDDDPMDVVPEIVPLEDQNYTDDDDDDEDKKYRNNWNEVDIKMEEDEDGIGNRSHSISPTDDQYYGTYESKPILEEEPDASVGVAGALKLALNKGYLDKNSNKSGGANSSSSISAQAYTIEEKFYDDDRMGRRDRYSGQLSEFKEKSNYRPDFKLDYVDEKGRIMSQKEAFRHLSHKFHGKGPGKNKIDKRMKKMEQESKLRQMSSIDTPLNTLKMLQEKQKEVQAPYVVLTGQRSMPMSKGSSTSSGSTQVSKKK